jgi:cbb3-type cytochrome oxidase subunit 3
MNFAQDWPVIVVMIIFAGFIVYVYQNSRKNSMKDKDKNKK